MALTDILCRTAKPKEKQYKLADSRGMFMLVMPNGAKYWRLKYRISGKEKILALGVYPEVPLKEARDKRDSARKQISNGLDPSKAKKEEKLQIQVKSENSFEAIAREWHSKQQASWTAISAIFNIHYSDNEIIKITKPIKELLKCENSSSL